VLQGLNAYVTIERLEEMRSSETVYLNSCVFIFHQLADVLEELPTYLNKNHMDNVDYILPCYQSQIDGFDTSIVM
jgi:hypothetical protein